MNTNVLEAINNLFETCGPQPFSEVLHEVRSQCGGLGRLHDAHSLIKTHLFYLISLGAVIEQSDEFGIVYGHFQDSKVDA